MTFECRTLAGTLGLPHFTEKQGVYKIFSHFNEQASIVISSLATVTEASLNRHEVAKLVGKLCLLNSGLLPICKALLIR